MKNRALVTALCSALLAAASFSPALAWVPHTARIAAVKTPQPPRLDPSLHDPVWQQGTQFQNFYDFTARGQARYKTSAYLLYDDHYVYFAAHCDQRGIPLVATQTVNNAGLANDDHVSLEIETSGSGGRVYQFSANPHGIRDESDSEDARYAPNWQARTQILPDGSWNVVMAIPLADIRTQGRKVQNWQVNVVRYVAYTNDVYTWAFDGTMNDVGSSQYWPFLTGLRIAAAAARPRPHADVYALGSAGADRAVFQNGFGDFQTMRSRSLGVDVTVPLTSTLAFVGTINPDFSNVEQDQTTIAPQEFQRQYTEYRPFFAQGAEYVSNLPGPNVNSADMLFYSPNIGVFNHGLKVEGTQGLSQLGVLNVTGDGFNDSVAGYTWNEPDDSLTLAFNAVAANHTGLRDDALGYAVATSNPHSGVFTIAHFATDRGTLVNVPSQGNDLQFAAGVQNTKNFAMLVYKDIGPQYAPVDGYVSINDVRGPQAFYQYSGSAEKKGVKSYILSLGGDRFTDRSGAARESDLFGSASVTFDDLVQVEYSDFNSTLRFYGSGYPLYAHPMPVPFRSQKFSFGYKDGTPSPIDGSYSWGAFANNDLQPVFLQQTSLSATRPFGRWGLSAEYDGAIEHALPGSGAPAIDSQWLRSLALTHSFGRNASLAIGLRSISGNGGYASPGTNLSIAFRQRFPDMSELYVDYGTPAAVSTLNRWIVKYVFRAGGSGT